MITLSTIEIVDLVIDRVDRDNRGLFCHSGQATVSFSGVAGFVFEIEATEVKYRFQMRANKHHSSQEIKDKLLSSFTEEENV